MAAHASANSALVALRRRAHLRRARLTLKLVAGIPLTFVGPFILASIFWLAGRRLGHDTSWPAWFALLSVGMVPALLGLEWRTRGRFFSQALAESGPPACTLRLGAKLPGPYVAVGGLGLVPVLTNPRGFMAGITEVFLTGPRLLYETIDECRARRRLGPVDVPRAAAVVAELAGHAEGQPPAVLLRDGEQVADLVPVLNWLILDNWIGVTATTGRVYLYSDARRALGGTGGHVV